MTALNTLVASRMASDVALAFTTHMMAGYSKVIGEITPSMVQVSTCGQMERGMKATGKPISYMDMECANGQMAECIEACIHMIRKMERVI